MTYQSTQHTSRELFSLEPVSRQDPFSVYEEDPFARSLAGDQALSVADPEIVSRPLAADVCLSIVVGWGYSTLAVLSLSSGEELDLVPARAARRAAWAVVGGRSGSAQPQRRELELPESLIAHAVPVIRAQGGLMRLVTLGPGSYQEHVRGSAATRLALDEVVRRFGSEVSPGERALPLVLGASVRMETSGVWLRVDVAARERVPGRRLTPDWAQLGYFGASLGTFGGLLLSLAYFTPVQGLVDAAAPDKQRMILLQQYLSAAAEREQRDPPLDPVSRSDAPGGEASAPAPGSPGEAGKETAERAPRKMAIKGPPEQPLIRMSPMETAKLAREFGMIGLLNGSAQSDPDAPLSLFARDSALGHDVLSARGNMWGEALGDAYGRNGLFLSGIDFGGRDGPGTGVGIEGISSSLGTLGHCKPEDGRACGFGKSVGRGNGDRKPGAPTLRTAPTQVSGSIPAEVVQRIVRQNFGRFRFCYEKGLARNPNLEGRVAVRFVIGRDGSVSTAAPLSGGLPDSQVSRCVADGFYGLSFPSPENGIVTVTYPLLLSPD